MIKVRLCKIFDLRIMERSAFVKRGSICIIYKLFKMNTELKDSREQNHTN